MPTHALINISQEMVEPLEETRSEIIFATEPILASLHLATPGSLQNVPLVELDEVEVCTLCLSFPPCRDIHRQADSEGSFF